MERFEFKPTSITDLISTRYFTVPRYQRSYAWTAIEFGDFWDDLRTASSAGGDYFLGNIVLTKNDDDLSFSIIDGQQRIATTTILISALRDIYREHKESDIASAVEQNMICALDIETYEKKSRIMLNEIDNPFYQTFIIEGKKAKVRSDSHKLIQEAKEFFDAKLREILTENPSDWMKEFAKITKFFKTQSRIVCVYAANDADAFTIFETLNDRGRDLTIADLLKNYLFARADTEINSVQRNWTDTKAILEEYIDETEFVTFLRHYWSSVHGSTREKELYRSIKAHIKSKKQSLKFSEDIKDAARLYGASLSEKSDFWKSYTATDRSNVQILLRLKLEQNRPLLLAVFQHFTQGEIQKTLSSLISWSIRGLIGGVMGKGSAESTFCDAAKSVRSGKIKTRDQLRAHLIGFVPSDSQFQYDFSNYRTNNNGFARLLLAALERKLEGTAQPELVPNENVDDVNLEHVLPKRGKIEDWPKYKNDEISFYSLRLGNMTLLKEKDNSRIGNKSFAVKAPALKKSNLKLNSVFRKANDWTKKDIDNRQAEMAILALSVWRI